MDAGAARVDGSEGAVARAPEADRVIDGAAREEVARGREGERGDRVPVPAQVPVPACSEIREADGPVASADGEGYAVGRDCHSLRRRADAVHLGEGAGRIHSLHGAALERHEDEISCRGERHLLGGRGERHDEGLCRVEGAEDHRAAGHGAVRGGVEPWGACESPSIWRGPEAHPRGGAEGVLRDRLAFGIGDEEMARLVDSGDAAFRRDGERGGDGVAIGQDAARSSRLEEADIPERRGGEEPLLIREEHHRRDDAEEPREGPRLPCDEVPCPDCLVVSARGDCLFVVRERGPVDSGAVPSGAPRQGAFGHVADQELLGAREDGEVAALRQEGAIGPLRDRDGAARAKGCIEEHVLDGTHALVGASHRDAAVLGEAPLPVPGGQLRQRHGGTADDGEDDGPVLSFVDDLVAVHGERRGDDLFVRAGEEAQIGGSGRPRPRRADAGARAADDEAVLSKHHMTGGAREGDLRDLLSGGQIPHAGRRVLGHRDEAGAVRRDRGVPDLVRVAGEDAGLACGRVPDSKGLVVARRDEALATVEDVERVHVGGVAAERAREAAGLRVGRDAPHLRRVCELG